MSFISKTPEPPYYAVIFSSVQSEDVAGYSDMAVLMEELARKQKGFLGIESVRQGLEGITVSYWSSLENIRIWRSHLEHRAAQDLGKNKWYEHYHVRIAKVERDYAKD